MYVQATRGGADFGASQMGERFYHQSEVDAYIAKRVADSRKAAAKKFAAPAAKADEWEPLSEAEQEANIAAECKAIREGRPVHKK
ncbi:hypothetical protein BcepF1.082 [Burkholderia phage BcepF1]|uniref:Uncharacterized protein n=1 Tax=Burkholderia phage BcepF1 TaxID=2886897 RepID=A1YZY6_9CAUD|nr:hypothetical protein BcepF1.082 [Burkholderia phage BcepF1]ABL96813.1 hypothetical protein BcepF1.082 [Burkholderia phage BcepF1]